MQCLRRNLLPFYYAKYVGREMIVDEYGNKTGEYKATYTTPIKAYANIAPATGYSHAAQFGNSVSYDNILLTNDFSLNINENTVLYVEVSPDEHFDYIVKRVAKSINTLAIAIQRVRDP